MPTYNLVAVGHARAGESSMLGLGWADLDIQETRRA